MAGFTRGKPYVHLEKSGRNKTFVANERSQSLQSDPPNVPNTYQATTNKPKAPQDSHS